MKRFLLFSVFFLSFNCFFTFADTVVQDAKDPDFSYTPPSIICSSTECYTVIKELGEGAFGKVYAVQNSNGRAFAIKTYKNVLDTSSSLSLYTDAQREFSRGQLLNHPNIIKSHDLFMSDSEEGIAHIVLDLVNGRTLTSTERGDIGYPNLLRATVQFIDALQHALSMKLMHLDLHGGNIMIDDDSNIMVIDLASFFTMEEIYSFLVHKIYSTLPDSKKINLEEKKSSPSISSAYLSKGVHPVVVKESHEPSVLPMAPARVAKLEKFFDEHPRVFKKVKDVIMEKEALSSIQPNAKKTRAFSKSAAMTSIKFEKSSLTVDSTQMNLSPVHAHYFDRITEICIKLISISDSNREEKIEMRANIKKIAWNYEEDLEEGITLPLTTYLDQLLNTLQSH